MDDPNPPKDANEALLSGRDIQEFLDGEMLWPRAQLTSVILKRILKYECRTVDGSGRVIPPSCIKGIGLM